MTNAMGRGRFLRMALFQIYIQRCVDGTHTHGAVAALIGQLADGIAVGITCDPLDETAETFVVGGGVF